jgi:TPP-dependent pyruvate/acetoin dehydrogenase alpha subunit
MNNLAQRIRSFEKRLQANMDKVFCPTHLSLGQEWVAVELANVMRSDDWLFSTHRNHHHYLAKGGSESRLWDEIMGLPTGLNGGFAGSQSITDPSINFHSSAIVGGLVGVAAGTALALKLNNSDAVAICCLGDAGTEQGVFWETLNFAALQALPLVFVIENNGKSVDAHISERQATPLTPRIPSFGVEVCESVVSAVERCRGHRRPTFFEARVTLECAHLNMATMLDLCTVATATDGDVK